MELKLCFNMMGVCKSSCVTYISIYLAVWTYWSHITEGNISDACHGQTYFNQTFNILQCESGTQICITEVRYYQRHPKDDDCPFELSGPVPQKCCRHNVSRCSWVMTTYDKVEELQSKCWNTTRCSLHSDSSKTIAEPCLNHTISAVSNVRSITYICSSAGSCPTISPGGTTSAHETPLTGGQTKESHQTTVIPKHSEQVTGAVVGGVFGGLVLIGIAVVLFIVLRRRSTKTTTPRVDYPASDDVTPPVIRPSPGYDNVNTRYSFYQPDRTGISEALEDNGEVGAPLDRNGAVHLGALYSKVNKNRESNENTSGPAFSVHTKLQNGHTDYDQVQGESAHFRVHGDYDHVAGFSDVDESSDVIARHGVDNPGIDMTYDQLHRGQAVTRPPQAEANPYDVLKRETTTTV